MEIANIYFEVIQTKGMVTFRQVNEFVKEFVKQCKARKINVRLVNCNGFCKVELVIKKTNRFYVQTSSYNYVTRECSWKLAGKAETYEDAMKKVGGNLYSHCGQKIHRILDREYNQYF